jgi:hypothetical protein
MGSIASSQICYKISLFIHKNISLENYLINSFFSRRYIDSFSFEYLDGTSDIQRKSIFLRMKNDIKNK